MSDHTVTTAVLPSRICGRAVGRIDLEPVECGGMRLTVQLGLRLRYGGPVPTRGVGRSDSVQEDHAQ